MTIHFARMANRFQRSISGKLFIRERSGFLGGGAIDEEELSSLSNIPGIARVIPIVLARLRPHEIVVFGLPQMVLGVPLPDIPELLKGTSLVQGRYPQQPDECLLGANLAQPNRTSFYYNGKLKSFFYYGGAYKSLFYYGGTTWKVAGVMERTNGQEDQEAILSLSAMEALTGRKGIVSYGVVTGKPNISPDSLAALIEAKHPHWEVLPPKLLLQNIRKSEILWNALTLGTGLLAVLIGGIGILTTMMMAVQEQTKEIAILKSLGASHSQVFSLFLLQSLLISGTGSSLGLFAGLLFVKKVNFILAGQGMILFEPTAALLGAGLLLAILLSLFGGFYPAFSGSKIRVAEALRR